MPQLLPVHARRRVEMIADEGTFEKWDHGLNAGNPLSFPGYEEKVKALQEKTNLDEAVHDRESADQWK